MLGSIIGDIVGSVYEFHNIKTKDFELLTNRCAFTDDTVLTLATADWLLNGGEPGSYYARYALARPKPPIGGYGTLFACWARQIQLTGKSEPYNSFGNGSAMRVGPVGWVFNEDEEDKLLDCAKTSAECTHNHPEGIKGAQAVALAIHMARFGKSASEITTAVTERFGYDLSMPVDEIRERYSWDGLDGKGKGGSCQGSVPQALSCVLQATDFEDAIRNAVSIGGDSDTITCMAGSIAEALFGIPENIRSLTVRYLPPEYLEVLNAFEDKYSKG